MADKAKRGWRDWLGLKAEPDLEEWVVVARSSSANEAITNYAERTVELLTDAGIEAQARPDVVPDDDALSAVYGRAGPSATARVRLVVLVHQRDQERADEVLRGRPKAESISDEELARLAQEAGPPPPE